MNALAAAIALRTRCRRRPGPAKLLLRALLILAALAVMHLLGWREHVSVIASTTGIPSRTILVKGAVYLFVHFAAVFVAPVLVLAAGIYIALNRLTGRPIAARPVAELVTAAQDGQPAGPMGQSPHST
jgi:hypothetical protein